MSILFIKIFKILFFKKPLLFYFYCAIIYIVRVQKASTILVEAFIILCTGAGGRYRRLWTAFFGDNHR